MIISSLHLENYRCFEDFDIDFDDRLTVLVGINGAGKTATLDALSLFLEKAGHPSERETPSYSLSATDISIGKKPTDVVYQIKARLRKSSSDCMRLNIAYDRDSGYFCACPESLMEKHML